MHLLVMKLTPSYPFTVIKVAGDRTAMREHRSFNFNHKASNSTNGSYSCAMKEKLLLIISVFSSSTY